MGIAGGGEREYMEFFFLLVFSVNLKMLWKTKSVHWFLEVAYMKHFVKVGGNCSNDLQEINTTAIQNQRIIELKDNQGKISSLSLKISKERNSTTFFFILGFIYFMSRQTTLFINTSVFSEVKNGLISSLLI